MTRDLTFHPHDDSFLYGDTTYIKLNETAIKNYNTSSVKDLKSIDANVELNT